MLVFIACGNQFHAGINDQGNEKQDDSQQEERLIVCTAGRSFPEFGRNGSRNGSQRFQEAGWHYGGIARHHQYSHGFANSTSDA